jgi:hypothetical protein
LYLGWLASAESFGGDREESEADDRLEPPVPPGLGKLSGALKSLAEFLTVDETLIEAAAAGNAGDPPAAPTPAEMARWIKKLPAADKDAYLLRFLAEEGDIPLRAELSKRFREATMPEPEKSATGPERRTVAQLLAAREALVEKKNRKAAADKKRRERAQARAHEKQLEELAAREPEAWREVEQLIATKIQENYDRAVSLLLDLREIAGRSGRASEAADRIAELRQRHRPKTSFLSRLDSKLRAK